ncbi:MAG: ABC transporter ATP-binding protein [Chloroflexi bacterium]|nr:ABC transporter ATP-binding protein [Chloroflexota bacterium]
MIVTKGLTRQFSPRRGSEIVAVDHLNLEIQRGEIFGLLGPNGAGKTTTVRMLSCLIAPSSGEAHVGGQAVGQDDRQIRRIVGLLTESPGLYEKLDAYTNLAFYANLYEVQDVERQVKRYLDMLGLWGRHREPVVGFSKGMKQKLAIARALIHEPQVLYLDEPTAALDPEAAKTVRDFVEELKVEGRTILLCTHNLDEAERLCDRIAVLKTRLIAVDTPSNLRRRIFGRRAQVRLRQVTPEMVDAVRALPSVHGVEQADSQLYISLDDPDAATPLIVRRLVELGGEIQQVTEQTHSLEETYLSLIKEAQ